MSDDKANILVVDDVPEKLLAMRTVLEELGQNVVAVSSGKEALRQVLDRDFAVILLDVNMPEMDGFETAALIRQRHRSEHIPIIFVTSYSDDAHIWQGYSLGAVDYIMAPVLPDVLRAKVGVFVELYRKTEQIRRHAEQRVALAHEQAARAAAEDAMRRSAFLASASNQLAASLDFETTVDAVGAILIPKLADRLVLAMNGPSESLRQFESIAWDSTGGHVERRSIVAAELPWDLVQAIDRLASADSASDADVPSSASGSARDALRKTAQIFRRENTTLLPLHARGRLLGSLALLRGPDRAPPTASEQLLTQDISGRAAIALDNALLYGAIRENDRRKDEFLAMLSHELRNPLAAMTSALDCLDLNGSDREIAEHARGVLRRQSKRVARMLDDLLDVSRITRGKIELKKSWCDLKDVVASAVQSTKSDLAAHQVQLQVSLANDGIFLAADPTRLEQVIVNLLNNAGKYTQPGGEIQLIARALDGQLILEVRDTGIGMSPKLLHRAFDLFAQGDRPLDRAQGGLGIGLTVVRRLIEMHEGSVHAYSEGAGRGTTVSVRLPLGERPTSAFPQAPAPRADAAHRRILVVDDNVDIAVTTSALLRRAGHEVFMVHDGLTAIEAANRHRPDAVLIDIGLPGMNGYEVAEELISKSTGKRPMLVAITGYGQKEDIERSLAAGFDHHLTKPVQFASLQEILATDQAQLSSSNAAKVST